MSLERNNMVAAPVRRKQVAVVLTVLMSVTGCANQYRIPDSKPVSSQAKAGTVLISPTLVAPWDDIASTLKPNFQLTSDQALAKVLPTTETISEQILHAFGASLAAGLPTNTISSKQVIGGDSPGRVTTIDRESGVAPAIANTLPSASLPASASPGSVLGLDPILQYKAANYLLQEVQLLNSGIENAAQRSCSIAYVVTLKLAVMNYRPRLPYSVHSHISFAFKGNFASFTQTYSGGNEIPEAHDDLAPECNLGKISPSVVPLLVADDVQVALKSRAAEAASQIAFGLSGLVGGTGIGANANALQQNLTAITNHDLTSALTIGRESENSIYAQISPNNQASNQASLASQTYDVTVLLLVPRAYFGHAVDPQSPVIGVTSYTEYRDAKTGEVLPDTSDDAFVAEGDRLLEPFLNKDGRKVWEGLDPDQKAAELRRLVQPVEEANPSLFNTIVSCQTDGLSADMPSKLCASKGVSLLNVKVPFLLWTRMGALLDYSRDKLSLFQARLPARITVPQQNVILADDGSHPIQAVLGGVQARSVSRLSANLRVTPFDKTAWRSLAPVDIPAQSITLNESAHTLTLAFPSLKQLNIDCLAPDVIPEKPQQPAAPAKPTEVKCPARMGGAGSEARPNAILLTLGGCDPGSQLCPDLTDTTITESQAVQLKLERLRSLKALPQDSSRKLSERERNDHELKLTRINDTITALNTLGVALANEEQAAAVAAAVAKPAENAVREASLTSARTTSAKARAALTVVSRTAHLEGMARDYAMLGVNLIPATQSTVIGKVALSNFGSSVTVDPISHTGKLVVGITPTPSTDTIAASVSGAELESITDQANTAILPDPIKGFILPKAGIYKFKLSGITPGVTVNLALQAMKNGVPDGDTKIQSFAPNLGSLNTPVAANATLPNN
jgi:hypothetical protein